MMRLVSAVAITTLVIGSAKLCPLNCEQQLLVVEDKESHAIEGCAAGEGQACDEAKAAAVIARSAWKEKTYCKTWDIDC